MSKDVRPFEEYKEMIQDMRKEEMIKGLYDLSVRITKQDKEIKELKRQIKIKDNWCRLIYDIGYDYDGFRNDIEGLRGIVDELVRYSVGALKSDDKTVVYVGEENGVEIKENILMERIEGDKE